MSEVKYLDKTGLTYFWGKVKAFFLSAVSYDTTTKKITVTKNGTATDLVTAATIVADGGGITSHQDITGKADKVSSATNGNFAGLDANGNLTDSGSKASDFITSSSLSTYAPLASPTFTGTPAAPTATPGSNSTQIATTAFVQGAIQAAPLGEYIVVTSLPTASAETEGPIYLIASISQQGEYDRFITTKDGDSYTWTQLGSTQIVSPTIVDNLTTEDATKALSAKQGKLLKDEVDSIQLFNTNESGFYLSNNERDIGLKYDGNGLDAAKVSEHFVNLLKASGISGDNNAVACFASTNEEGFSIVDPLLNIGVKVDSDGIQAKNIVKYQIL